MNCCDRTHTCRPSLVPDCCCDVKNPLKEAEPVAECMRRGAAPPVDFLAVCFVLAICRTMLIANAKTRKNQTHSYHDAPALLPTTASSASSPTSARAAAVFALVSAAAMARACVIQTHGGHPAPPPSWYQYDEEKNLLRRFC
jgi:hypothetical protein